jgi:hypothetical protein
LAFFSLGGRHSHTSQSGIRHRYGCERVRHFWCLFLLLYLSGVQETKARKTVRNVFEALLAPFHGRSSQRRRVDFFLYFGAVVFPT